MTPKTARLITWSGPLPKRGHVLETSAGSAYLVLSVRRNRRPDPRSVAFLHLGKLDFDELAQLPPGTRRHAFAWNGRKQRDHNKAGSLA